MKKKVLQPMVNPNLIQLNIVKAEEKLKDDFGFTTEHLEQIGLDCPTSIDYLFKLEDKIEELENEKLKEL